jgi:hypothetical protein
MHIALGRRWNARGLISPTPAQQLPDAFSAASVYDTAQIQVSLPL